LQLAADGADVAIVARSVEPHEKIAGSLNETAELIRRRGSRCIVIGADLSHEDDRSRIVPEAIEGLGGVDILVNNAAAAIYQPPETYSLRHRRLSMEVNYHAPADLMQALVPHLIEAGEGWIVNLTHTRATVHRGSPDRALRCDQGRAEPLDQRDGGVPLWEGCARERGHAPGGRAQRGSRHPRR
jgi:citronellol/citronellal dehydrogenase